MQKLLRLPQVLDLVPFCRSQLYIEMERGRFPKPIKISERANAWIESEVVAFVDARIAERETAGMQAKVAA
jgi:prophage regulatory protein